MANEAEQERALAWLEQKWKGSRNCPICSTNQWTITDVLELRPFTGGGLVIGGGVFPVFQVICNNCAFAHTFNAVMSGVAQQAPDSPSGDIAGAAGVDS